MKTKLSANRSTITLSEAVTWVACRKGFYTREDVYKRYRRYGGRLPHAIHKKLDNAGDEVARLIINGVSARGSWREGDDPRNESREVVRIDFLKDGVFVQAADDRIYADHEKESNEGAPTRVFDFVELDIREFFAALSVPLAEVQEDPRDSDPFRPLSGETPVEITCAPEPETAMLVYDPAESPTTSDAVRLGRPIGAGTYETRDAPLVKDMHQLISDGTATSKWAAAMLVVDRAAGSASDASKCKRLVGRYSEKYGKK